MTEEALHPPKVPEAAKQAPIMPTPEYPNIPPDIAKDPRRKEAYLKGFGPPVLAMTPDVKHNVEKAARAKDLEARSRPSVPYPEPPPPKAGPAVVPRAARLADRQRSQPCLPTRIYGQPSTIGAPEGGGGAPVMGQPGFIPTGATSPYGGGYQPSGMEGGGAQSGAGVPSGGGGGGGAALPDAGAAAKAQADIAAAAKAQPSALSPQQQKGAVI